MTNSPTGSAVVKARRLVSPPTRGSREFLASGGFASIPTPWVPRRLAAAPNAVNHSGRIYKSSQVRHAKPVMQDQRLAPAGAAVLIRKVGRDLKPKMEIVPAYSKEEGYYKGVQLGVLTESRYFYNPVRRVTA